MLAVAPVIAFAVIEMSLLRTSYLEMHQSSTAFEDASLRASLVGELDECLQTSQWSLASYVKTSNFIDQMKFRNSVSCLNKKIAASNIQLSGLKSERHDLLNEYQTLFEKVVELTEGFKLLREKASKSGPQAHQAFSELAATELNVGSVEASQLALLILADLTSSLLAETEAFQGKNKTIDLTAPASNALENKDKLLAVLSSESQIVLAKSAFIMIENYIDQTKLALGNLEDREAIVTQMLEQIAPTVNGSLLSYILQTESQQAEAAKQVAQTLDTSRNKFLIASLTSILIVIALALIVGSWISNSIRQMANLMNKVALGNYHVTVPNTDQSHELGDMARALEIFQANALAKIQAESEAEFARKTAETDTVTGLANRRAIDKRISDEPNLENACVALIDLDEFKPINDTFGHDAGDHVLKTIGHRLSQILPADESLAARLGGDEFGVIIFGHDETLDLDKIGEIIIDCLVQPIEFGAQTLDIGGSVGVALLADVGGSPQNAWKAADKAMYEVKKSTKNAYCVFDPSHSYELDNHLQLNEDKLKIIAS